MVDARFHILSLVAVFLALATGMVIGGVLSANGAIAERQQAMVLQLRQEFDSLRQREKAFADRVAALEDQARWDSDFASGVAPLVVGTRLAGRRLVLAMDGAAPELERGVAEMLRLAGGDVSVMTAPPGPAGESVAAWQEAGRAWGAALAAGRPDGVVLLALSGGRGQAATEGFLGAVIAALRPLGVPVVGAETRESRPSLVPFFRRQGVSSIDDADLLAGRVALVYLLAGARGHYGVKGTADGLLPQLPGAAADAPEGSGGAGPDGDPTRARAAAAGGEAGARAGR